MTIARIWGTTPDEQRISYPCDRLIPHPEDSLFRGITIYASPQVVFRWLCQMRVAPYSYDWIDNGGRESPRTLTPGLEDLVVGQDVTFTFTVRNQGNTWSTDTMLVATLPAGQDLGDMQHAGIKTGSSAAPSAAPWRARR